MDRASVIVASRAAGAIGLAVTGQASHAGLPIEQRTIDRDVDLGGVRHVVVRTAATDVHVIAGSRTPRAHVHLALRGTQVAGWDLRVDRRGDTATIVLDEGGTSGSRWSMSTSTAMRALGAPVDVSVSTASGNISADAMPRAFSGRTASGDVTVRFPRGDVEASTASGDVSMTLDSAFAGGTIGVGTASGDVDLRLPRSLHASLQTRTVSGTVVSDIQ